MCGSCALTVISDGAYAQESASDARQVVVATVGGEPIYAGDVERLLDKVIGPKEVNPAVLPWMKAQVLAEAVDRRLVLAYARRKKSGAGAAEVDAAIAELKRQWEDRGRSLANVLREQSSSMAQLQRQIAWNLTWKKFLGRYVTEARLKSYFDAHRREFDGTQLAVSHVLLRAASDADAPATARLFERARAIRREISSGAISFAEAARKYSAGPSGKEGGRLGMISRHGPMSEAFSRAAFALEVWQMSESVRTPFGVHLIRCDEIKPGGKQLAGVRQQITEALGQELIAKLARLERDHTPVEFTGAWPHFKPGTRELVQE